MNIIVLTVSFFYVLGIISAAHAVMCVRTSQGAIAWALSLLTVPVLSVPAYWIFGRRKFAGYVQVRKTSSDVTRTIADDLKETLAHSG